MTSVSLASAGTVAQDSVGGTRRMNPQLNRSACSSQVSTKNAYLLLRTVAVTGGA